MRSPFETDQENHLALLFGNSRRGRDRAMTAQLRIGRRYGEWPRIVDRDGAATCAMSDDVCILVMHNREEPGAKVGTPPPVTLPRNCADEGILDEVVGPGTCCGSMQKHSAAAAGFLFREVDRIRSS
jgi:hypothetical protein